MYASSCKQGVRNASEDAQQLVLLVRRTERNWPVASIPIPGERRLRPVKNRGESFVKGADQKFFSYFLLRNLHLLTRLYFLFLLGSQHS